LSRHQSSNYLRHAALVGASVVARSPTAVPGPVQRLFAFQPVAVGNLNTARVPKDLPPVSLDNGDFVEALGREKC
jgi:hypothetical protein